MVTAMPLQGLVLQFSEEVLSILGNTLDLEYFHRIILNITCLKYFQRANTPVLSYPVEPYLSPALGPRRENSGSSTVFLCSSLINRGI